jgi:UDP-glucuronate 4-epimerase
MPDEREVILVTGAAGFIGSHTAEALLARGSRVVGVDNFDSFYDPEVKLRNAQALTRGAHADRFTLVEGDICDADAMSRLFADHMFTGVIHLAARAGVRPSIEQPALYARVNVEGTTVLLEEARKCETCARFVQASSSSVYGNNSKVPFSEDDDVNAPISPYAATKRACELIAGAYHSLYGMPIASLRFFTVYGPRQRPDLAIGKFMRLLAEGRPIPMFGDGATSRDYTFIDDIVSGVVASYDRITDHGLRIWNLGGSDPVTLRDMIDTISRVTGIEARIDQRAKQPGDVERTFADTGRSERELGYRVSTTFEEGVRRQWEWLRGG